MALGAISRKVVYSKSASLTIASTTSAKRFTLPDEATITRVMAFTTATSAGATLNVGTAADDNLYIAALDVSGAGSSEGTILDMTKLTKPTDIYMNIGGAPAGGGPYTVVVEFTSAKSTGPK
jgi:hypothetical protein